MATYVQAFKVETMTTGIGCLRRMKNALGHKSQTLRGLKRRAWRILTHDATVEQRFPNVLLQFVMTLRTLAPHHHAGVVAGRRYHTKHFAGVGLNGYDRAYLALHQPLTKSLQVGIDAQREILAWDRSTVELAVLVTALNSAMGIA